MIWIVLVSALIIVLLSVNKFKKLYFVRLFSHGNVLVSGMRGRGKDLAFCTVINARKKNYISNVQYSNPKAKFKRFDFDPKVWALAGNTYTDMVDNTVKTFSYPYPDGIDYYISDAGIYFPSQYQAELVKRYKGAPLFQALSRHLGDCNVHCNSQNQNRIWDKIREQSDIYIVMKSAWFVPGTKFFRLSAYEYSLEESAEKQIIPPRFGLSKNAREQKMLFENNHGRIKKITFWSRLPYSYDSRRFKRILENNLEDYENEM